MRRLCTLGLVLAAVVPLAGCGKKEGQDFQLSLVVHNLADGQPLPGVTVLLDTAGSEESRAHPDQGVAVGTTDAEGRLTHQFRVSPYPSDSPHWWLKLSKEGYTPVVRDIRPKEPPGKQDAAFPIALTVGMEPEKK